MISFSQAQYDAISQITTSEFIHRVIDILKSDESELIIDYSDKELFSFVEDAYEEAKALYIKVELDVYEYVVFALRLGLGFIQTKTFTHKEEWFQSEYVPSVIKIKEINSILSNKDVEEKDNA